MRAGASFGAPRRGPDWRSRPSRVVSSARLVEYAWGYDGGDSALLKTHVCHLREKLAMPISGSGGIKAVPGVGYKLLPAGQVSS